MIGVPEARALYRSMLRIRTAEERIAAEYKKGYMKCPVHLAIGQEAVASGVCLSLGDTDCVTSNHRSHGHYLAKGGDLFGMLAEICGLECGCTRGWGGSQHLFAPEVGISGTSAIVGGGIPIATGIAWGLRMKGSGAISVAFFGDGATDEGYFYESLNFAALKRLPVLYVCENNTLATHSRIEKRRPAGVKIFDIARSLGVESCRIDGNNAVSVYETARSAISAMRGTPGPYLIEAATYRWRGHVTPDEDWGEGYRTEEELRAWQSRCPIARFSAFAMENGLLSAGEIDEIRAGVVSEVDGAFERLAPAAEKEIERTHHVPATPY
jgi:pyruvate dehydrogenase E1 component alpha subunit